MEKYITVYGCSSCDEIHDDEHSAIECCQPEVYEMYNCVECGKQHDEKNEAISCCGNEARCPNCARNYSEKNINGSSIKITGHCTVCAPHFTIDQQHAIEDVHYLLTGRDGSVIYGASK